MKRNDEYFVINIIIFYDDQVTYKLHSMNNTVKLIERWFFFSG